MSHEWQTASVWPSDFSSDSVSAVVQFGSGICTDVSTAARHFGHLKRMSARSFCNAVFPLNTVRVSNQRTPTSGDEGPRYVETDQADLERPSKPDCCLGRIGPFVAGVVAFDLVLHVHLPAVKLLLGKFVDAEAAIAPPQAE